MFSSNPVQSRRPVWQLRSGMLVVGCVLAACGRDVDPFSPADLSEIEADPDPAMAADPVGDPTEEALSDAERVKAPGVDAGRGVSIADSAVMSPPQGSNGPRPPTASGSPPDGGAMSVPRALDAAVPDLTVPALTGADEASLACAGEFAACVLADVLGADRCLDDYAECEPEFRGDGGLDGTCAVHFSACVLGDPLGFEGCFAELAECGV